MEIKIEHDREYDIKVGDLIVYGDGRAFVVSSFDTYEYFLASLDGGLSSDIFDSTEEIQTYVIDPAVGGNYTVFPASKYLLKLEEREQE